MYLGKIKCGPVCVDRLQSKVIAWLCTMNVSFVCCAFVVVSSRWLLALCVGCCFAVACLGLCLWVQARSSDCLAAEVQSWWCRQSVGGTVQLLVVIACSWVLYEGSSSVVKLLGGRGAVMLVLSRLLMAPCLLLRCDCVLIGLCVRGSCSVVIDCRPRAVTLMWSY